MGPHTAELKGFTGENVVIRFLWGNQERKKSAFIKKLTGSKILMEGLKDFSGRLYRVPFDKILEIKSLENPEKLWRNEENGRI